MIALLVIILAILAMISGFAIVAWIHGANWEHDCQNCHARRECMLYHESCGGFLCDEMFDDGQEENKEGE